MIISSRSGGNRTFLSNVFVTFACVIPLFTITLIYSTYLLPDSSRSDTIDLSGTWLIHEGAGSDLNTGVNDMKGWKQIAFPGSFHNQGYTGTRYTIRRDFTLREGMGGKDLFFMIGGTLGSVGPVYFNGHKIGNIGININGSLTQGSDDKYGFIIDKSLVTQPTVTVCVDFRQLTPGYGGIQDPRLFLGTADSLESYYDRNKSIILFFQYGIIVSGLFVLGIICILLLNEWKSGERRKYISTIIFILTVLFYNLCFSGSFLKHVMDFQTLAKLLKISIPLICVGSLEFIQYFYLRRTNIISLINTLICGIFIIAFLSVGDFPVLQKIYSALTVYLMLVILYICVLSAIRTVRQRSRYGLIISVSIIITSVTGVSDLLTNLGILHMPMLFNTTISLYIVLSSMIIIIQFISISNANRKLSRQLLRLNKTLETKVESRTKELRDANKKLRKLDAQKNDFIVNITHDFRSPLTAILNSAEMELMKGSPGINRNAEVILHAASRIDNTINRLLDLAKLDSHGIRPNKSRIDLVPFIGGILDFYRVSTEAAGLKIISVFPDRISGEFYSDSERLDQILNNIISNAVKFSDPHTGVITVDLIDEQDRVTIVIADNGVGIPRGKLRKIFKRFEQIHNRTNHIHRGTGIGLAFARDLTLLLNGKIWAESNGEGSGSRFFVSFPKGKNRS